LPARARVNILLRVVRGPCARAKRARAPLCDFPGLMVRAGTANKDPRPAPRDVVATIVIIVVVVVVVVLVVMLVPPRYRPARRHMSPIP
jgi:hypothetical protein